MIADSWICMESGPATASFNMAVDETLLLCAPKWTGPILRFYSWSEPAASFGYFQAYETVSALTSLRPLVRRCTGGGLVCHDADWTYSLLFPASHPWHRSHAEDSYRRVHEWVRHSLLQLGFNCDLAACCAKETPGACFAGPEKFDLVHNAAKIAGAAQRRAREGLLIQGSVQGFPSQIHRTMWERSMLSSASQLWGVQWCSMEWPSSAQEKAITLDQNKYSQAAYNQKRRSTPADANPFLSTSDGS